jgi:hypothetical protein
MTSALLSVRCDWRRTDCSTSNVIAADLACQRHKMTQISAESIQTSTHQHIESPTTHFCKETIKGRTPLLAAADPTINELMPVHPRA